MNRALAPLLAWLGRLVAWAKPQRWGLGVAALALLGNVLVLHVTADVKTQSDGIYSWMYARSLAFDHDIDFTNDYAICGDKFGHNKDRGGGHPDNPFYVGPALFWVPAIEVARVLHRFPPGTDEATRLGCKGPILWTGLHTGAWVAALVVWLSYLAARRFVGDFAAAITAGLFAFGTTLAVYATYQSSYSHVYDAACVAALLLWSLRAYEAPTRPGRWALAGVALAAALLHRPTNLPLVIIPGAFAVLSLWSQRGRLLAALAAVGATAALLGVAPLLMIYRYLYGRSFGVVPQGQYFLQPTHPHVWLLLFAPKGLFFMAPVAWLSVAGALLAFRRRAARPRLLIVLTAFVIELYIAAIPLDWDASSTIGARRLLPMIPLLVVLAAVAVGPTVTWFSREAGRVRVLVVGLLFAPMAFVSLGESLYFSEPEHFYDYYPSQDSLYGNAFSASWRAIDQRIGALAVLPAQLVFTLRYGLPHEAYWKATHLSWYLRDHQTMRFARPRLELKDRDIKAGLRGFVQGDAGATLESGRGSLVFCVGWPAATDLEVVASAATPTVLRVTSRSFFGFRHTYGAVRVGPDERTTRIAIPRHTFDSGVVELLFEADDPAAAVRVASVEIMDRGYYAPVK